MPHSSASALREHIALIEETYEFMLAYAAQGLLGDEAGGTGAQLRDFLSRCSAALAGLPPLLRTLIEVHQSEPAASYQAFIDIIERGCQVYTHRPAACPGAAGHQLAAHR